VAAALGSHLSGIVTGLESAAGLQRVQRSHNSSSIVVGADHANHASATAILQATKAESKYPGCVVRRMVGLQPEPSTRALSGIG